MSRILIILFIVLSCPFTSWSQGFSDEFNGSIDSRWEWVRSDPTRQLILGSQLTIITQNGALYGVNFNNARNLLLQQAPVGSYTIETKVSFDADSTFHNAGVIYYLDDDNFVSVSKGWYLGQRVAMMTWEEDAQWTIRTVPIEDRSTLYLRLTVRKNIHFTGEYSNDGITWHVISDPWTTYQVSTARIGLKAANGEGVNVTQRQIPARFDFFRINTAVPVHTIPIASSDKLNLDIIPSPVRSGENVLLHIQNPARDGLEIRIVNLFGQVVESRKIETTGDENAVFSISTDNLSSAVYIVCVTGRHGTVTSLMHVLR